MIRLAGSGLALALAMVASCSSSGQSPPDFPDLDVAGRDANPDGVPYPTDHLGGVHHAGKRLGDRIPNFTFQAYVDGDRAAGLKTISLADYFDPEQKRHKILHIEVAALWCAICSSVASETVQVKDELDKEGVVLLEIIVAGRGLQIGPSLGEVDGWVMSHHTNFSSAIDVRARRLSTIGIDGGSGRMPWDLLIDTRTMEILNSSVGAPQSILRFDRDGLDYVGSHPPAAY
jgi:hypothetical protein